MPVQYERIVGCDCHPASVALTTVPDNHKPAMPPGVLCLCAPGKTFAHSPSPGGWRSHHRTRPHRRGLPASSVPFPSHRSRSTQAHRPGKQQQKRQGKMMIRKNMFSYISINDVVIQDLSSVYLWLAAANADQLEIAQKGSGSSWIQI